MSVVFVHSNYRCEDCEGTDAPLYHTERNDGHNTQIVRACEHLIRLWHPGAPADLAADDAEYLRSLPPGVTHG